MSDNIAKIHLHWISENLVMYGIKRFIDPIVEAIQKSRQNIRQINDIDDEDFKQYVIDDESDVTEALIGTALIVYQMYITKIVSKVIKSNNYYQTKMPRKNIKLISTKKSDIMRYGNDLIPETNITKIEAINALANYFKHHSEWKVDWSHPTKRSKETMKMLRELGATPCSTGNLRRGIEKIGIEEYDQIVSIIEILNKWRCKIYTEFKRVFTEKGLI